MWDAVRQISQEKIVVMLFFFRLLHYREIVLIVLYYKCNTAEEVERYRLMFWLATQSPYHFGKYFSWLPVPMPTKWSPLCRYFGNTSRRSRKVRVRVFWNCAYGLKQIDNNIYALYIKNLTLKQVHKYNLTFRTK